MVKHEGRTVYASAAEETAARLLKDHESYSLDTLAAILDAGSPGSPGDAVTEGLDHGWGTESW